MRNSILYNLFTLYGRFVIKLYFKRIEIHGLENIPKTGPVILVANHQNAFLDAILTHLCQPRPPHFLTRGDVFNKPLANLFLRSLKMRPIFRFRDGLTNVKKNEKTFEECFNILESGQVLAIFPEGNHDLKFNLRTLQKGCARIVYDTEKRNDFELNVHIVPFGIQYYGNQHSRSKVLIQVGEPILSIDFKEFKEDEKTYHLALTERIKSKLSPLILQIPSENYDRIKRQWLMRRYETNSMIADFKNDQLLIDNNPNVAKATEQVTKVYKWLLLPIAIYGAINHIIVYPLAKWFVDYITTEKEFLGSVKFAVSIFLLPLLYGLQTWALSSLLGNWSGIYFISLPLSGMVFKDFIAKRVNKIWAKA